MISRPALIRKTIYGAVIVGLLTSSAIVPLPVPSSAALAAKVKKVKQPKFEDRCKPLRQPFSKIKNYQTDQILKGAVIGALGGVLLGILEARNQRGEVARDAQGRVIVDQNGRPVEAKKGNNILEYGIAGAIGGGLVGYLTSIEKNRENRAELQAALGKFDDERAQYSTLPQALADLGNCRNQQIFMVQQQFDAQVLTAQQASKRLDQIDLWIEEDDKLVAKASKTESDSIRTYAQANAVADGMSAQEANQKGDLILAKYQQGAEAYEGEVDLEEDTAAAQSIRTTIAASGPAASPLAVAAPVAPIVAPAKSEPVQSKVYVSAERANIRAKPTATATVLGSVNFGTALPTTEVGAAGWTGVLFNGSEGFVSSSLVSKTVPSRMAVAAAAPMRKAPRPDAAPLKITAPKPKQQASRAPASKVTRSLGDSRTIGAANTQRKASNGQQMMAARNRLAASLGSAQT